MAVMRSLVANGYGFGLANIKPLNNLSPDGKPLRTIPLLGDERPMRLGLLMATDADNTISVKSFIDYCVELVKENALPGIEIKSK